MLVLAQRREDRAKKRRATFANFIHKKDAGDACHVIQSCLLNYIPVYTVHENFLSPAVHAHKMPALYRKAFIDLAPPLYIVNRLLS